MYRTGVVRQAQLLLSARQFFHTIWRIWKPSLHSFSGSRQVCPIVIFVDPRYVFLAFWLFCVVMIMISTKYSELSSKSLLYQGVFYSLAFITVASYLYTGICDAGVITPNEDNAIENADQLEKLSYSYCTVCKLFRPPKAAHCSRCGVCFRNMDHHCVYMGQLS